MDEVERKKEEIRRRDQEKEEQRKEQRAEEAKAREAAREKAKKGLEKRNQKSFWELYQDYFAYGALGLVVLFIFISSFSGDRRKLSEIPVNDEEFIMSHNDLSKNFTVGKIPFFEGSTLQTIKEMANNKFSTRKSISRCNPKLVEDVELPNDYNFYSEYSQCRTEEQLSKTSSSYAEVPISLFRNRNCKFGGETTFIPSLKFLFACDTKHNTKSKGGYIVDTLNFMTKHGIISESCWDEIGSARADDKAQAKKEDVCPTAEELKKCTKDYMEKFCVFETVDEIKKEIKKNGPVATFMLPYKDLLVYKTGVYAQEELKSKIDGVIFVKVVGWETNEDGTQSWLVDPMLGREWGVDGIGKILIGTEDSLMDKIGLVAYPSIMEKAIEQAESEEVADE